MRLLALYWWIDRWRKSSAFMDMTLEEQGAYRNLLDEAQLRGGPLPNDERILAKACGDSTAWPRVQTAVMARFELRPDGWHNVTLDAVLKESLRRAKSQSDYRDRKKNGNGSHNTTDNERDNKRNNKGASPSPSPSPSLVSVSGPVSVITSSKASEQTRKGSASFKAGANGHSRNGTPQEHETRAASKVIAAKIVTDEKVRRRAARMR